MYLQGFIQDLSKKNFVGGEILGFGGGGGGGEGKPLIFY